MWGIFIFAWTAFGNAMNQSQLTGEESQFLMKISPENILVDGNQLKLTGSIIEADGRQQASEKIVIFYQLQSEPEKELWLNQTKTMMIKAAGVLETPEANRNRHQFNYQNFLFWNKIHFILNDTQIIDFIEVDMPLYDLFGRIQEFRSDLRRTLERVLSKQTFGYVQTFLFGDKTYLDQQVFKNHQFLGVVHLLNPASLYTLVITICGIWFCLRLGLSRRWIPIILLLLLAGAAFLLEMNSSMKRQLLLLFIFYGGQFLKLELSAIDRLSIAFCMTGVLDIYSVFQIGHQFSYSIIVGIFILREQLKKKFRMAKKLLDKWMDYACL